MNFLRLLLLLAMIPQLSAGVPEVIAYQKIRSPYHEVPNPVAGASVYEGCLLFTNRYLVVYEPQILDSQGNVQSWGYLEVFDRLNFVKLGEIHPAETAANKRWGTSLAISGDYLAAGSSGTDKTPGVDVYDLKTFRRIYHLNPTKGASMGEYGWLLEAVGTRLLIHAAGRVFIHDFPTGKRLGALPLFNWYSEKSASLRFVLYGNSPTESGYREITHVVDLKKPKELLRISDFPFLDPERSSLDVKRSGRYLCLIEHKNGSVRIHGYDLFARKRLFSVNDKEFDGRGVTVWKDRLFVSRQYSSPVGDVVVRDLKTGKVIGRLLPGTKSSEERFGSRIACVRDTLFVSSDKAWHAYDPATLKWLYRVDDQGWNLSLAEPVPVKGSALIGFVFNFKNNSGMLINSYYYNPQVMLLDTRSHQFTHRLNLEEGIAIGGFYEPVNFGRVLHAAGPNSVAVERPGFGGDYKIFSLSPSVGGIQQKRVASVSYESTLGYGFEVRRTGTIDPIQTTAFGSGKPLEVDVPYGDFAAGAGYELVRSQRFRVKNDYDVPWEDFTALLGGKAANVTMHGGLAVVCVPSYDAPKTSAGAVYVLDSAERKIIRMIQAPNPRINERFGSSIDLDGNRLAVGSSYGTYVYDTETGEMLAEFPAAMTLALSGNILIRGYNETAYVNRETTYNGLVTACDIATGKNLYTVSTGYVSRFSYDTTRIAVGGTRMLLGLNVHDLATGEYQFTLTSPDTQPDDNFPSSIAADGEVAAVAASGRGAAYLFDLKTGAHFQTCQIQDRPEGFTNFGISGSGLALDAAAGILGWVVPDPTIEVNAGIHLFDVSTGGEIAKIVSPTEEVTHYPFPPGSPTYTSLMNIHNLANAVALDGNRMIFLQDGGDSLGACDASALREAPLLMETVALSPTAWLEVQVETRRDTIYQIFAGPSVAQASETGISFQGTGSTVVRRIPIPPNANSWVASIQLKWADPGVN